MQVVSPKNVTTLKDLEPYYQEINMLVDDKEYGKIADVLIGIDVTECSTTFLVGILQLLYPVRDQLLPYTGLVSDTYAHFESNGLDAPALLRGL